MVPTMSRVIHLGVPHDVIINIAVHYQPRYNGNISHEGTKTQRKKNFVKNFVSWCLGGENLLFDKSFATMM